MLCDCGGRTYVVNTRQHGDNKIRRQRKCEKCREWFYSIEVREFVPLKNAPVAEPKPMAKVAEKIHRKKVEARRKLEDLMQERKQRVPNYFIEEEDY